MSDNPNIFAVGDTVRVSNIVGPRMVVVKIENDVVGCMWFDRRNEVKGFSFRPRFLSKASPWEERPRMQIPLTDTYTRDECEEHADAHD